MMLKSDLLTGKVAFITGCNRGIGKSILELFANNGATIWACSRKETNEQNLFLEKVRTLYDVNIYPLYFDLNNEQEIREKFKRIIQSKERIDILVNNAGIAHGNFFQMTPIKQIREVFETNFFAQLLVTQFVTKLMIKQGGGSVINLSSIAGIDADAGDIAYGSSKAALIYATKTLSKELASYNIRVNAIAPGLTSTDMAGLMEIKAKERMMQLSSMKRLANPEEIANTALFLASDLSSFINGQVIRVDGGI